MSPAFRAAIFPPAQLEPLVAVMVRGIPGALDRPATQFVGPRSAARRFARRYRAAARLAGCVIRVRLRPVVWRFDD
jgi:hypothetical protein